MTPGERRHALTLSLLAILVGSVETGLSITHQRLTFMKIVYAPRSALVLETLGIHSEDLTAFYQYSYLADVPGLKVLINKVENLGCE